MSDVTTQAPTTTHQDPFQYTPEQERLVSLSIRLAAITGECVNPLPIEFLDEPLPRKRCAPTAARCGGEKRGTSARTRRKTWRGPRSSWCRLRSHVAGEAAQGGAAEGVLACIYLIQCNTLVISENTPRPSQPLPHAHKDAPFRHRDHLPCAHHSALAALIQPEEHLLERCTRSRMSRTCVSMAVLCTKATHATRDTAANLHAALPQHEIHEEGEVEPRVAHNAVLHPASSRPVAIFPACRGCCWFSSATRAGGR